MGTSLTLALAASTQIPHSRTVMVPHKVARYRSMASIARAVKHVDPLYLLGSIALLAWGVFCILRQIFSVSGGDEWQGAPAIDRRVDAQAIRHADGQRTGRCRGQYDGRPRPQHPPIQRAFVFIEAIYL
jgi:hypothetical protein